MVRYAAARLHVWTVVVGRALTLTRLTWRGVLPAPGVGRLEDFLLTRGFKFKHDSSHSWQWQVNASADETLVLPILPCVATGQPASRAGGRWGCAEWRGMDP